MFAQALLGAACLSVAMYLATEAWFKTMAILFGVGLVLLVTADKAPAEFTPPSWALVLVGSVAFAVGFIALRRWMTVVVGPLIVCAVIGVLAIAINDWPAG